MVFSFDGVKSLEEPNNAMICISHAVATHATQGKKSVLWCLCGMYIKGGHEKRNNAKIRWKSAG